MVKAYLRYEQAGAWGVVSSAGGCAFDTTGRLLATACLENVGVWSIKQGAQVRACCGSRECSHSRIVTRAHLCWSGQVAPATSEHLA